MSVDGHPATLARNIAVSLDTEIDEPAAARGRALRAVLAAGGATPAAWGRELVSGPAAAPQTVGQGWIDVVYFRQDEGNILEPAALAEAHRLELALRDDPAFTRLCQKATEDEIQALDASMCRLPDSAMNFFFPTVRGEGTEEETLITNGRGAARAVQDTAKALLLSKQEGYFDRFASASDATVKSVLLGSRHFFGGPLPGYSSTGDRRAEQQAKYQAFTSTLLRMSRETQTSAVRFVFVGDGATVMTQIFEELAASVIYAVAAVGFILGYVWLQTGSLWLACASAAQILLTFPVTYLLYTTVMGYERIGIMNLMSLWAIAGIGVDDVFLLTEMFKHSRKESRASETMPDESSRLLADVADNRRATRQAHDRHAALTSALAEGSAAMLVTSLTTAASFYANAISRIPAVRGFGLWTGTLVVANYVLVLTFFASALSFYEANFRLCLPRWAARPVALSPQLVRNDWYPPSAAGAGVADYNLQSRALDDYTAAALLTAASEPITPVSLAQAKAWARINTSPAPYPFLQHELSLPQQLPGGRFKFRVRAEGPGGPGPFSPESAELVMPGNIGPPGISPSPSASPAPSDAPDSGGGGDPFSPRVEPCYGLFGGQDCSTKAADPYPLSAGSYSMVALILGVAGSKPNPSFVPSESAGSSLISSAGTAEVAVKADAVRETSPILDPAFDLADPAAQAYMIRLCEWIEEQPDLVLYKDPPDCWMRRFRDWLASASGPAGVAFPVTNRTRFPELLVTWARQHGGRNFFGVSTVSNQVVWARMLLRSTIDWQSAGFVISQQEFPKWQAVVEHVKATAPSTLGSNPVQASDVWLRAFVEEEFVTGTALACAISVGAAFLTTLCFVQSIALAMFTAVAVGAILVTLLAFIVLSGSSLGVIEAIAVVCLVGLSIDAALHFAHGYIHAPVWLVEAADERAGLEPGEEPGSRLPDWAEAVARLGPRGARASFAMQKMGWPIVSSAITTAGASAFLLLTTIEILRVFGVILVFTLACSLVITIVGLSALLSVAGPRSTLCEACARGCCTSRPERLPSSRRNPIDVAFRSQ
ncbi:hypothetical protein FNF28_07312 [Cafeteria roenbergensis]|uniref:SSD domain-containing protein n=1 Tax=Cafeteria roenbergensis TaxID=33653 RepID=A0A5A8C9W5_CAFRO|nr:hypothetical protein FNF28_07312 [Cafeteria roenbergensis]